MLENFLQYVDSYFAYFFGEENIIERIILEIILEISRFYFLSYYETREQIVIYIS